MNAELKARRERRKSEMDDLRDSLELEHGVDSSPLLRRLFQIAWNYGHDYGLHEVENQYRELFELVKPSLEAKAILEEAYGYTTNASSLLTERIKLYLTKV